MKGFLYKDWVMSKMSLIVIAVLTVITAFIEVCFECVNKNPDAAIVGYALVIIAFYAIGLLDTSLFTFDEKRLWQNFAASTPQSFKAQAQSKYLLILAVNLFPLFVFMVSDLVGSLVVGRYFGSVSQIAFAMFSFQILVSAVEIPFFIRFGSKNGANIKLAIIGAIFLAIGIYLLFGDISFLFEGNFTEFIINFFDKGGMIWAIALLPYVSLALYFLSYRISVSLYRKGAECYDN
ncbi:MAG: ABC-2 transporter permease [Oscillospiraceae bacterium]